MIPAINRVAQVHLSVILNLTLSTAAVAVVARWRFSDLYTFFIVYLEITLMPVCFLEYHCLKYLSEINKIIC